MKFLITGLLLIFSLSTFAQKVLVVEKIGRGRYFTFKEGDMIRLGTKKGGFRIHEEIRQVDDSSLLLKGNYSLMLSDIDYIEKVYRNRKSNGIRVMIAGGLLLAITSVNNTSHDKPVVDPLFLSISAGLAAAGGIWWSLEKRKYPIGDKWKLKVLDGFL